MGKKFVTDFSKTNITRSVYDRFSFSQFEVISNEITQDPFFYFFKFSHFYLFIAIQSWTKFLDPKNPVFSCFLQISQKTLIKPPPKPPLGLFVSSIRIFWLKKKNFEAPGF
jgi:hypothetical protein